MTAVDFASHSELAQYVVSNTIAQAAIVNITFKQGRWFLFHF